eukprot:jgi/Ulvmu1/8542/UM044_0076.1
MVALPLANKGLSARLHQRYTTRVDTWGACNNCHSLFKRRLYGQCSALSGPLYGQFPFDDPLQTPNCIETYLVIQSPTSQPMPSVCSLNLKEHHSTTRVGTMYRHTSHHSDYPSHNCRHKTDSNTCTADTQVPSLRYVGSSNQHTQVYPAKLCLPRPCTMPCGEASLLSSHRATLWLAYIDIYHVNHPRHLPRQSPTPYSTTTRRDRPPAHLQCQEDVQEKIASQIKITQQQRHHVRTRGARMQPLWPGSHRQRNQSARVTQGARLTERASQGYFNVHSKRWHPQAYGDTAERDLLLLSPSQMVVTVNDCSI